MTTLTPASQVGQLVAERASRAKIFERFGIDYCCGGKISLEAACARKGIDPTVLLAAIEALDAALADRPAERDWTSAPLPELVDHVLTTHHAYLREAMPRLAFLVAKVARVHGDAHPELAEVLAVYTKFHAEMDAHMAKEEQVLFPLIVGLAEGKPRSFGPPVQAPIAVMEAEHDDAGRDLEAINRLTGGHAVPEGACNSYRAMLDGLRELELDTFRHIHLENNVLFPRALAIAGASAAV
jgi:regulator of cell morphogenesis and NO signaling